MLHTEHDFRDRLLALRASAPSTPLVDVAREAAEKGLTLRTDRNGWFDAVSPASPCHPTVARIRAAIVRGGR